MFFVAFLAGAALAVNLTTGWLAPAWRATFAAHVAAAAGGWFIMLVIGISYHLLTFFGFVEKKQAFRWPKLVRRLLHLGIGLAILAAALPSLGHGAWAQPATGFAGLLAAAACGLFVWDGRGLYAPRGRERMHPAVGHVPRGPLVSASVRPAAGRPRPAPAFGLRPSATWMTALGFLAAAGWLSGTILGYLHRILPFIVWHNRYWGRGHVPGVPPFEGWSTGRWHGPHCSFTTPPSSVLQSPW